MHADSSVLNSYAPADVGGFRSFYAKAETDLAGIRSGILIFLQDSRQNGELDVPIRDLNILKLDAQALGQDGIAASTAECERVLKEILYSQSSAPEQNARRALDLLAEMEASLVHSRFNEEDASFSISGFLDESFERLTHGDQNERIRESPELEAGFEIDEETLEIFRTEASELLETISENLKTLTELPHTLDALWNIRRSAHTFKGAAGVIGLKEASELSHRVEDLLDQLAEDQRETDTSVIELLTAATEQLRSMTLGCSSPENSLGLAEIYSEFDRVIADSPDGLPTANPNLPAVGSESTTNDGWQNIVQTAKPPPAPIVRVALHKLDELLNLTRSLTINRSSFAKEFIALSTDRAPDVLEKLGPLFETQRQLTNEIQDKIFRIRMVRFGMLATRLNRAVHVTCQEENKKAEVVIDSEDFEIDTQILDSLVEPLLHLLRNAVVHGIESPERRRLIGKPEKGQIWVDVGCGDNEIVVSVRDDGRGISISKLREKAVASGITDRVSADALTDAEVFDLMFLRGITTADNLSLNAGRGVGMSIVKESIGSIGGSIAISTEPQKGSTFTMKIPLVLAAADIDPLEESDKLFSALSDGPIQPQNADLAVLVVDDSSSMRQMITRMIEKIGGVSIPATDGQNAIELLSHLENRPDIILTDLEMPHMDGYEFLEFIKKDDALRDIPVVMITSRTGQEHRQKAFDLGVVDFMTKPFSEESLLGVIDRVGLAMTAR